MANQRQQMKKKKKREAIAKARVLKRREDLRKPLQEENQWRRKIKRINKLQRELGDWSEWSHEALLGLNDSTLSQLERNAQILKALEQEYEVENNKKRELNQQLEDDGLFTLEDKMNHLHQQLIEEQKAEAGVTGSAESQMKPKKPRSQKEVAEVEIVRAPILESKDDSSSTSESV